MLYHRIWKNALWNYRRIFEESVIFLHTAKKVCFPSLLAYLFFTSKEIAYETRTNKVKSDFSCSFLHSALPPFANFTLEGPLSLFFALFVQYTRKGSLENFYFGVWKGSCFMRVLVLSYVSSSRVYRSSPVDDWQHVYQEMIIAPSFFSYCILVKIKHVY